MSKRSARESRLITVGSGLLLICIAVLSACGPRIPVIPPVTLDTETSPELCVDEDTGAEMSYTEAARLAQQSECTQEGGLAQTRVCNPGTGTWWIDMDIERPGCAPACVVDINTGSAEINWRCTGLVSPEDADPTQTPETDIEEAPTATAPAPDAPDATPTLDAEMEWPRYTDEGYGFTFYYPASWDIELLWNRPETEGRARAVRLTRDELQLLVEYKQPAEDFMIGPDDLPEGEVIEQGTLTLLGQVLPRYVLEREDRALVVFVGEQYVDLDLYIEMRATGEDIGTAEIPEDALDEFERIVSTFVRTGIAASDPYPGWAHYTRSSHATLPGFTFRYPLDWSLDEVAPADASMVTLTLRNETVVLQMELTPSGSNPASGAGDTASESISEAGTVSFLGATYPRQVEVEEGRLKKVSVIYRDSAVQIQIALSGDPDRISYEEIDLGDSPCLVMDQILASFTLDAN
jgi:hypothetical protein